MESVHVDGCHDGSEDRRPINSASRPFFKTRLCDKYEKNGFCPYGADCTYAHGKDDMHRPPPYCEESDRRRRHRGGHGFLREEQPNPFRFTGESPSEAICIRTVDCVVESCVTGSDAAVGGNNSEGTVTAPLSIWKTKMCYKWENNGRCNYGESCSFAHGQAELRRNQSGGIARTQPTISRASTGFQEVTLVMDEEKSCNDQPKPLYAWSKKMMLKFPKERKLNNIYGDWIDGGSPRRNSRSDV